MPIWRPLYRIEKNFTYTIRKVGTNYTQCVHRIRLRPVTPQGRVDDLIVINFDNFQRDPSLGHFRSGPTLFDERFLSLLEPPIRGVATRTVTEDPPPVTVGIRFPIAPAPIPLGLAAVSALLPAPAVAVASVPLVGSDRADVAAEPQTQERPQILTQDVRFTNDDIFQNDELAIFNPNTSTSDNSGFSLNNIDLQIQDEV